MERTHSPERRRFLQAAACVAAGAGLSLAPGTERQAWSSENDLHIVGPKPGYAPYEYPHPLAGGGPFDSEPWPPDMQP